jgi:DNA-3-methyladenine glycosylase I
MLTRCAWCGTDPLYVAYHDEEWGVPVHDDQKLFEMLILEGAQAGLSWLTILRKRAHYRQVFDNFDPQRVAGYDAARVAELLADPGIVRNRLKVEAAVQNAKAFLAVQAEFGTFAGYIWRLVDGRPVQNSWQSLADIPAQTAESQAIENSAGDSPIHRGGECGAAPAALPCAFPNTCAIIVRRARRIVASARSHVDNRFVCRL